jgi:creatinine amidohydrolase
MTTRDTSGRATATPTPGPFPDRPAVWLDWKDLTGADIDALPREHTVVLVSVSPLEVHGPHLPTICDNLEAEALSHCAAEKLKARHPELVFLHLPPIYTAADVLPHVGSIAFRSSTIRAVLEDLGRSLCKQGFARIWVSSFHGGPRHFVPIEMACAAVNARYGGAMVSTFGLLLNLLTGGSTSLDAVLGGVDGVVAEDLRGDAHGGAVETSILLHLAGERVREGWQTLPQRTVDIALRERGLAPIEAPGTRPSLGRLFRGFRHKIKYFEDETYAGKPSVASDDKGAAFVDILAEHAATALDEVLRGERALSACYSPLWKARWLFANERLGRAFERAVGYRNRVF